MIMVLSQTVITATEGISLHDLQPVNTCNLTTDRDLCTILNLKGKTLVDSRR